MKKNLIIGFILIGFMGFMANFNQVMAEQKAPVSTTKAAVQKPIHTTPLIVVDDASKFLGKTVKMQATFDKFSALGLDYKKALRPSSEYIGILLQRDNITDNNIPLSEMKLFMKKSAAEKFIDLDTGDKIEIIATVFSNALNDPWLDIVELKVLQKAKK